MPVTNYGFIVKGRGLTPAEHRAELRSAHFATTVVGVESVDQAAAVARSLVAAGAQVIELCGAFDSAAAEQITAAAGGAVPIGVVHFDGEAKRRLETFAD